MSNPHLSQAANVRKAFFKFDDKAFHNQGENKLFRPTAPLKIAHMLAVVTGSKKFARQRSDILNLYCQHKFYWRKRVVRVVHVGNTFSHNSLNTYKWRFSSKKKKKERKEVASVVTDTRKFRSHRLVKNQNYGDLKRITKLTALLQHITQLDKVESRISNGRAVKGIGYFSTEYKAKRGWYQVLKTGLHSNIRHDALRSRADGRN